MPTLAEVIAQKSITLPEGWDPRPDQMPLWKYLVNGGKRAVQISHRRWGKDEVALHYTCCAAMERQGNYWHMLPEAAQARKVIWTAINARTGRRRIDEAFPGWLRKKTNESEMLIEFINGSVWQLVGSDNYSSLVGSPPVGLVFSEWAIANPLAWGYLSPILEENGGWVLFITTPRGNNHGRTMLRHAEATPGWYHSILPATQTPVFGVEQLDSILQDYRQVFGPEMGEALYNSEYLCEFDSAQIGAYYAKQISQARQDGRIGRVPYNPAVEVDTFWDLGIDDSMSIWFCQAIGKERRLIDYYEASGYGLEHYAKVLKDKPYVYGTHFMPHDAEIREMSSGDIAQSRREVAEALGIRPVVVVPRAKNMDMIVQVHIPAVRNFISQCWIDESKCALGLSAIEGYHAEYNEERKTVGNRPAHNWMCHAADSLRTGAVGYTPRAGASPHAGANWRSPGPRRGSWRTG